MEVSTRVAVVPLERGAGLLREAMSSLHTLIEELRIILREEGPDCSPLGRRDTAATLIIQVVADIRAFLAPWHPRLQDWETQQREGRDLVEHEDAWPENDRCRTKLAAMQAHVASTNWRLTEICGASLLR